MTDYHTFTTKDMPMKARRRVNVGDIWMNSAMCKFCMDILVSNNRHDFKTCKCGNLSIDGGSFYIKRVVKDLNKVTDLSEMYEDANSVMLCKDCGEPLIPDLEAVIFGTDEWDGHTYKGNCVHYANNIRLSSG